MDQSIREIGIKILLMGMGYILGVMEEYMTAIGKITRWKVKVAINGQMEEHMLEIILMIRNMDKVSILGNREIFTMGLGKMENNMEKLSIQIQMEK